MREIPLTQGKVALVDDEDYERVSALKWYAMFLNGTTFYAASWVGGKNVYLHRFVLRLPPRIPIIDHKNHDGLDCRKGNLRLCDKSQNAANRKKRRVGSSKFKGVCLDRSRGDRPSKWLAYIGAGGKTRIGYFKTEEEAAMAYDELAVALYGKFALLNFPEKKCV